MKQLFCGLYSRLNRIETSCMHVFNFRFRTPNHFRFNSPIEELRTGAHRVVYGSRSAYSSTRRIYNPITNISNNRSRYLSRSRSSLNSTCVVESHSGLSLNLKPATFQSFFSLYNHIQFSASFHTCISNKQITKMPEKRPFQRLPSDVVPVNYSLRLQPDLKTFTFDGYEEINVNVKSSTDKVILNYNDVEVSKAHYQSTGSDRQVAAEITYDKDDEKVTFKFPAPLQVGEGKLCLSYKGNLNDNMKGFYRSKYSMPDGEERYAAVTQFEPVDARRAFPCWDEPAHKATFDVTLVVPKNKVALSNMPIKSEEALESDPNLKVVVYEKSPIMSTYLLAFVVGDFDYVEAKDEDGVLVRVYTPLGKKTQGQFALDVSVKTLPFYKKYFKIAYPLPKMDLIAIPDFAAGAMENWGLITYRETALLFDPSCSSTAAKMRVAIVVGHEIAHMWFGNLVTMEWWTHLWLNEGFASWIEYLCVDNCFPEFDIWTMFVSMDFSQALMLDALHTSHPIEVPVGHPSEIDEIFDSISYSKGAAVIRMLHQYIGDDHFRSGLNIYLKRFEHKNTFTEDLWAALEEASKKPVAKVMNTWTSQMGFPVIKVSQKQDGNNRVLTLTQEKFCADGKLKGASPTWMVPISICSASCVDKPIKQVLLSDQSMSITLDNVPPEDWIKLNPGSVGFYRAQYTSEMLDVLIPAIKNKVLPPRDRLGLQSDLFALSRAGLIPCTDVLKVVEAYSTEDNFTVWSDLNSNLAQIGSLIQYTSYYDQFKEYGKRLFKPVAERLGWDAKEKESPLDSLLRELALAKLGAYGDKETIEEAQKRFNDYHAGTGDLCADIRTAVYTTVLANGNEETFDKLMDLYGKADMQEERVRIQRSLGAVKQDDLLKRTLDFSISQEKVRPQDTVFVLGGVTRSKNGREKCWEFTKQHWKYFCDQYKGGFLLARVAKYTTENFASEDKLKEVEEFFRKNPSPSTDRTIQQSLENIQLNIDFLARNTESLEKFFTSEN